MPSPKLKGKIREKRILKNNKSFKKKEVFSIGTKRKMIISDFMEQLEKEVLSTYKITEPILLISLLSFQFDP